MANVVNDQVVGVQGDNVVVLCPKVIMTQEQAMVHAAWLLALSMRSKEEFLRVYEEVCNT